MRLEAWRKPLDFIEQGVSQKSYEEAVARIRTSRFGQAWEPDLANASTLIEALSDPKERKTVFQESCSYAAGCCDRARNPTSIKILYHFMNSLKLALDKPLLNPAEESIPADLD